MAKPVLQSLAKRVRELCGVSESDVQSTPPETPPSHSPKIAINKVYYLHLRVYDESDQLLPWGGATIAYQVSKEEGDEAPGLEGAPYLYFIDVGIANCRFSSSSRDLFCKRIGRDIALARLLDDNRVIDGGMVAYHPTHAEVLKLVRETFYQEREEAMPQVRLMIK